MRQSLPLRHPPADLCILRLSAVGDVCHCLAVVRTLQETWPATRLTWVIGSTEAELVRDIPGIAFIVYDKKSGRQGMSRLRRSLEHKKFDVLMQMQPSLRATRVARGIRADIRLGFDRARAQDFQWLFTTHRVAPKTRPHVLEGLFGFAEVLGIQERVLRWDIPIDDTHQRFAAAHIPENTPTVLISPLASGSARGARNWLSARFAEVADYCQDKHGLKVILTGSPSVREHEAGAAIEAAARQPVTNLIGQTSLKQLYALIARATVLICPDSGPGHMATVAGTPVISLFAGTNPDRAAPYLSRQWVVNKYPEALRRYTGKSIDAAKWGQRVHAARAMELIEVADVTQTLDRLMAVIQTKLNHSG